MTPCVAVESGAAQRRGANPSTNSDRRLCSGTSCSGAVGEAGDGPNARSPSVCLPCPARHPRIQERAADLTSAHVSV